TFSSSRKRLDFVEWDSRPIGDKGEGVRLRALHSYREMGLIYAPKVPHLTYRSILLTAFCGTISTSPGRTSMLGSESGAVIAALRSRIWVLARSPVLRKSSTCECFELPLNPPAIAIAWTAVSEPRIS